MTFLINCSNLKAGGGLQVADSICGQLENFMHHKFIVVISKYLVDTQKRYSGKPNLEFYEYDIPDSFKSIIFGRDLYLDSLVEKKNVHAVLTVFGPSRWCPRIPHLSGFALAQIVIPESPFFRNIGTWRKIKWWQWRMIRKWSLKKSASYFWTENPYISKRLEKELKLDNVYTVSNYYNQVFDEKEKWKRSILIPEFEGITCLSVSTNAPHKNFSIAIEVNRQIRQLYPNFKIRFVFTFHKEEMIVPDDMKEDFLFVGRVDVSEVPFLYEQCDIMFMPSLIECFTATYPEAMRMKKPIVTTDLEFARGLCGDAACYFSAVDPKAAAEALYLVATDKLYSQRLIENGKKQLLTYDNFAQRAEKLINILENIACTK